VREKMADRKNYQEEIRRLLADLSDDAQKLVKEIARIEGRHQHKSRPTGIADEIVSAIKGLVK